MNVPNKTKGFTIIEVVLVLAIAGLIFLVVFLALPALQRGQRDSQRKTDLGKFMSQVTSYQSNNQGALPASTTAAWNTFIGNYLRTGGTPFSDPEGQDYSASVVTTTAPSAKPNPASGNLEVYIGYRCDGAATNGVTSVSGNRNIAVFIKQEQGGVFCQNN
jgi:prepilin-type N-terminal cleavage/methylation domain-containing protein